MKRFAYLLVVIIVFANSLNISAKDYNDKKYKFSISVPDSWSLNEYMDGTDKVYDFLSPDENVFIQVRSFAAVSGLNMDLLCQVFKENYIPAGSTEHELIDRKSSNGIPGRQANYTANYNGVDVGISVFYVLEKDQGYTLMAIAPLSMMDQKQVEVGSILKTFLIPGYKLANTSTQSSGGLGGISNKVQGNSGGTSSSPATNQEIKSVAISNLRMGDKLSGKTDLLNETLIFKPDTENLYVVFDWRSEVSGQNIMITWFYDDANIKIDESTFQTPSDQNSGSTNASLSKPYEGWPEGNYHIEFTVAGQIVAEQKFSVSASTINETDSEFDSFYENSATNESEEQSATDQGAVLFSGSQIQAQSSKVKEEINDYHHDEEPARKAKQGRKSNSSGDITTDIAAQRAFWLDCDESDAEWEPMQSHISMNMKNLSSPRNSTKVYVAGGRKSTMYAAHIMEAQIDSKTTEQHTYSFIVNNKHYGVDACNDIFTINRHYNWMCGQKGMVMFSYNAGTTWYAQSTPTKEILQSISFIDHKNGLAVGDNGAVIKTTDGGQNWETINIGTNEHLSRVLMVSTNVVYILPKRTAKLVGFVYKSTDGGNTWQKFQFESFTQTPYFMNGISFINEDIGWICGDVGHVYKTEDGGRSWERQASALEMSNRNSFNDIEFVTEDEGWACGNKGTLLHTTNGGKRWKKVDLNTETHLLALEFNGPYIGYVAGNRNLWSYHDQQIDDYYSFNSTFNVPNKKTNQRQEPTDKTYTMKAYQVYDFTQRAVVNMTEFSGYGFYLCHSTDKLQVMGGLLQTEHTDPYSEVSYDTYALNRVYSNSFITIEPNKVCMGNAAGGNNPKVIIDSYQLINENGENIPQITFRVIFPN